MDKNSKRNAIVFDYKDIMGLKNSYLKKAKSRRGE